MSRLVELASILTSTLPREVTLSFLRELLSLAHFSDLDYKDRNWFTPVSLWVQAAQKLVDMCLEGKVDKKYCRAELISELELAFADLDPSIADELPYELRRLRRRDVDKVVNCLYRLYETGLRRGLEKAEHAVLREIIYARLRTFDDAWKIIERPYSFKLKLARAVVREALKLHRKWNGNSSIIVFWSGGKSSTAVLALVAEMLDPEDFIVVYNYTWLDPEPHLDYMKRVAKQLGIKHFYVTIPRVTPLVLFMLFGFPKPGRSGYREPVCSLVLKKYAAIYAILKLNARTVFTGEQAVESEARMRAITKSGLIRQTNKYGGESLGRTIIKALPVGYWTRRDVEKYLQERGIEESPVYRILRSGRQCCLLCTNFANWREVIENAAQMLGKPTLARTLELLIENWGWQKTNAISLAELAERLRIAQIAGKRLSVEQKLRILDELFVLRQVSI